MIPLAKPHIDDDEIDQVARVLRSGYLTQGKVTEAFENVVADYLNADYAVATSSCTTALHLALLALGIGPGDEVLVPDFTFPATANVVVHCGATPVLVDIDLDTFNINVNDLASKITWRSKAIMPVHLFGLSANMGKVAEIADSYEIAIIEDAACALGTQYYDRKCGAIGDAGCFSFHPRKIIAMGEGGMLVTNELSIAEVARSLRSHGGVRGEGRYSFAAAGYNYRLSDVHSAIGIAQMKKLKDMVKERRQIAQWYDEALQIDGVRIPSTPEWKGHTYQAYIVLLQDDIDRDAVIGKLREKEIETTIGTYALHLQKFYHMPWMAETLTNSAFAFRQTLALPLYVGMTQDDVGMITDALRGAVDA